MLYVRKICSAKCQSSSLHFQEQARIHYDCPDIHGVELENGGGEGTASAHWELRTLGVSYYTRILCVMAIDL